MPVLIGYAAAATVTVIVLWAIAGRDFVVLRDPNHNLAEVGGRHVGILSGLAGYAVTGMVLLVTLGRSLPDTSGTAYTTVLTMFFVSWMAYSGTAFLFANLVDPEPRGSAAARHGFDVPAAQFAGAAITLEFAFGLGWMAIRPLFQAFGLTRLAETVTLVIVVIAFASYGLVAHQLNRSGYGPTRVLIAIPVLAVSATLLYGTIVALAGLHSAEATLDLIVGGFAVGAVAFFGFTTLSVMVQHDRAAQALRRFGSYLVLAYAQAVMLFVGFLVLSILGLG